MHTYIRTISKILIILSLYSLNLTTFLVKLISKSLNSDDTNTTPSLNSLLSAQQSQPSLAQQANQSNNNNINNTVENSVETAAQAVAAVAAKKLIVGKSLTELLEENADSVLGLACASGYIELVTVLLAINANVEDKGHKNESTPLMEACANGHK